MKKFTTVLLLIALTISLSACDFSPDSPDALDALYDTSNALNTLYDTSIEIGYPELPLSVSYVFMGTISTTCEITKITHELDVGMVEFTFYGERTDTNSGKSKCAFSWRILDENDYVVDSGKVITAELNSGDKFSQTKIVFDLDTDAKYTLELYDYEP